jgi:CRISPR/Cas system CSM-associated protein Csm2 small subunit
MEINLQVKLDTDKHSDIQTIEELMEILRKIADKVNDDN